MNNNNRIEKDSIALVNYFFENVWQAPHRLNIIDELMTEDYKITSGGKVIKGRNSFKTWVQGFHNVLLDAKTVSVDAFSNKEGTKVVSRWICTGKNNGVFGLESDKKPISFTGIAIWNIKDNHFTECWVERSALETYRNHSL
ncbi:MULTISPECIES: ester cyclase [Aquimarina]|uniref:ester cyclase n=1 Tax=Aquimarina TaxID=290174 RepID=UPI00094289DA|nr:MULTISPECIES: ester cyclase [Aquimarina]